VQSAAAVTIQVDNIKNDSIGYRILHFIEGKELLDTILPVEQSLIVNNLKEDMYLLVLSWPRTLIPHRIFNSKAFDPAEGDLYYLTKAIYINPNESVAYKVSLDSPLSVEDIEMNEIKELKIHSGDCKSCKLAETYWNNYDRFFERKNDLMTKLNKSYYQAVNEGDTSLRNKFLASAKLKNSFNTDEQFKLKLDSLIKANPDAPVSTFFLFYQLYADRNFEKYRTAFELLEGNAKASKYYHSIEKRY